MVFAIPVRIAHLANLIVGARAEVTAIPGLVFSKTYITDLNLSYR